MIQYKMVYIANVFSGLAGLAGGQICGRNNFQEKVSAMKIIL